MNHDQIINALKNRIPFDESAKTINLKKCHGSFLVDADGKEYLDFCSSFGSMPISYNNPKLLNKMMEHKEVFANKTSQSDIYSETYVHFMEKLFEYTPKNFKYIFTIEGGSPAVENALKVATDYTARKLNIPDHKVNKLDIIHLQHSFHGRLGLCLGLTCSSPEKTALFPKHTHWTRIVSPAIHYPINLAEIIKQERESLEAAEAALRIGKVAGLILETIQSEGGHRQFRKEYLQALRTLTNKYGVLLIFDEVQVGAGVTGKFWCFEHYDVQPDIICFGKKLQCCGILVNDKIDEVPDNVFKVKSRINSTWAGNIVDILRGSIVMDMIREDNLLQNVTTQGSYMYNELQKLESVSNIRGIGTLLAWDMRNREERDKLLSKLNEKMFILGCGDKSIRLRPFLDVTKQDCDLFLNILEDALKGI